MRRLIISALAFAVVAAGCAGAEDAVQTRKQITAEPPTTTAAEPPTPTAAEPPTTTAAEPPTTTAAEPPTTTSALRSAAAPASDAPAPDAAAPAGDTRDEVMNEPADPSPASDLAARVVAVLDNRSFREFDPSRDADKRKGVILNFFAGIELWAQYSEGRYALAEWQINAESYSVEGHDDGSEVTLQFNAPRGRQILPEGCETCVDTHAVSVSVMNVFDPERIAFRVNDPYGVLRSPFPVFESWTRFGEDEYFD